MRVLFATNHAYPPRHYGGSESSTHDLCLTLLEHGHDVAVLSAARARPLLALPRRPPADLERDDDGAYPVYRAAHPSEAVTHVVAAARPDVAVVQAGRPLGLAEPLARMGVPCVVYLRDTGFEAGRLGGNPRDHPELRYLAVSADVARRFAGAFGIEPVVVPPLVRPERYLVDSARRAVVFVCPFPQKGLEVALALAERRPDVPFVFVESWQLHPVRRLILERKLRARGNATFRGPADDMRTVYREAKLILVPSRRPEGWGRVVSEAQVSGIPALASRLGGLPEAVGDGGVLVDPAAGIDAWESALSRLWDDGGEYERLSAAARRHARRAEFQPDAILARLLLSLEAMPPA